MKYDYIVLYSSQTGNTKKLATEIFSMLPGIFKDLRPLGQFDDRQDTDTYFVGFWTNMETCNVETMEFLTGLHGKNVALFGTCGMGEDSSYRDRIIRQVVSYIPSDNRFLGAYLCQGKMPDTIRRYYLHLYEQAHDKKIVARLLYNFDQALLHPNQDDYDRAGLYVNAILDELHIPRELSIK